MQVYRDSSFSLKADDVSDQEYPRVECPACGKFLYRGFLFGEIKCGRCKTVIESKRLCKLLEIAYNQSVAVLPVAKQ